MYLRADVLVQTAKLSPTAFRLLIALEQCCRKKPSCWYGNEALADMVGCSDRRVRSGLAELEKAGWIRRRIDPATRHREEIVLLRRLDPDRKVWSGSGDSEVGRKRPRGRTETSGEGRTETSARIRTESEVGRSEEAERIHSAHADRGSRGRERSTRSAGAVPALRKGTRKEPRMTAREMDAAIREYAQVAGTPEPGSPWAERHAEPFQAPANDALAPRAISMSRGGGGLLAVGQRGQEGRRIGTVTEVHDFRDAPRRPGIRYRIRFDDGEAALRYDYGNGGYIKPVAS